MLTNLPFLGERDWSEMAQGLPAVCRVFDIFGGWSPSGQRGQTLLPLMLRKGDFQSLTQVPSTNRKRRLMDPLVWLVIEHITQLRSRLCFVFFMYYAPILYNTLCTCCMLIMQFYTASPDLKSSLTRWGRGTLYKTHERRICHWSHAAISTI